MDPVTCSICPYIYGHCFVLLYEPIYIAYCFAAPYCPDLWSVCPLLCFALAYIWHWLIYCPDLWSVCPLLCFGIYIGLFGFCGSNYVESDKSPHFFRFWPFALFYALLCPLLYMPVYLHWLCLGCYIALYGLH